MESDARLLRYLGAGGRLRRSVVLLAGGTAVGQVATIAAAPLLTRLYSVEAFGVLSVYAALLAVLSVVVSMRYELAIPLPATRRGAANVLGLAILVGGGVTALVALVLAWPGPHTRWAYVRPAADFLWLLPIGMVGAALYQSLSYWAIRAHAFPRLARTAVSQSVTQVVAQVGAGLAGAGPLGLLAGHAAGQFGGVGTLLSGLVKEGGLSGAVRSRRLCWAAKRYRRMPLFATWASAFNMLGLQVPAFFFAAHYGLQAAGWLALGQRLMAVPVRLVGKSVAQVYLGETAQMYRGDSAHMARLLRRAARRLLAVSAIPALGAVVAGPAIFSFVFGAEWREAGVYVQILAVSFVFQFVVSPLSQTLNVTGHQHWQLGWDVARTSLIILCFAAVAALHGSPRIAIAVYAAVMAGTYAGLYALLRHSLAKAV